MALACLVCHSVESPSHSFRSYSLSSSDNEGRCSAIVNCLTSKVTLHTDATNRMKSKVVPVSILTDREDVTGAPRLVRSRAVSRDLVRDWYFD